MFKSFENNILSHAKQSAFEINIAQFFIVVLGSCNQVVGNKKVKRIMFHRRFYESLSQRPQTLKNALNFLVELKPLFLKSFQGSRTQFQSKRLVMLWTEVYVTADLYQGKRPDIKAQNLLTLHNKHAVACTQVYTVCLHLEQAFETLLEEIKLDTDVLEETFAL